MNLLEKFEAVEITQNNIIPEIDLRFCEKQFNFYTKIYNTYKSHLATMKQLVQEQSDFKKEFEEQMNYYPWYISTYSGIGVSITEKEMFDLSINFASTICDYFNKKYSISTNITALSLYANNKQPQYVTLDEVLNKCILGNLNGLSFIEKAIEEIKAKAKTEHHYREYHKEWNYDVKGKTIKFRFGIDNILPALWFYDNGETKIINYYTHNKVDDCRKFENGNTDIKFHKSEYAMEFARKYLGYVV